MAAAVAHQIQSIDLVCVDYTSDAILEEECMEGATWGFTGKQVIHPNQIATVNASFVPSDKAIDHAHRILQAAKEGAERGVGAVVVDGKMVDEPVVKQAKRILDRAGI